MTTLDDRRRAGKRARKRGARGELEVRDLLREYGWTDSHRQWLSGGQGGGDLADAIPDFHLEVKLQESLSLPAAFRQARAGARPTDTVVVIHRGNWQSWFATLPQSDWRSLGATATVVEVGRGRVSAGMVRAEMMSLLRASSAEPAVGHPVSGERMVTVLLADLLALLARAEADETERRR